MVIIIIMKKLKLFTIVGSVALTVLIGSLSVFADWSNPTATPPSNNVATPINVSGTAQTKTGALTIGSDLVVNGRICLGTSCINAWPEATEVVTAPEEERIEGVCGASNGQVYATTPTTGLCATGTASAVSNAGTTWSWFCNGSGSGIDSPCNATRETNWVTVATANKPRESKSDTWAAEKTTNWTANGPIYGVRVSGNVDDGGYCYASWGTGNVATWRHDPATGVYNVDNSYHDGSPIYGYSFVVETRPRVTDSEGYSTCPSRSFDQYNPATDSNRCMTCPSGQTLTVIGDSEWSEYVCLKGYDTCPTNPPTFTNDGTAKICQIPWDSGAFTTKSVVNIRNTPLAGTVFALKSNFTDGPSSGHVNCTMDVLYK